MHCVFRVGWMKMCTVAALFLGYQMVSCHISNKTKTEPRLVPADHCHPGRGGAPAELLHSLSGRGFLYPVFLPGRLLLDVRHVR